MNLGIIFIVVLAALWAFGAFMGAIRGLAKPFQQAPHVVDSTELKEQVRQTVEDTEQRRQQMMDDLKRKMDQASHRY